MIFCSKSSLKPSLLFIACKIILMASPWFGEGPPSSCSQPWQMTIRYSAHNVSGVATFLGSLRLARRAYSAVPYLLSIVVVGRAPAGGAVAERGALRMSGRLAVNASAAASRAGLLPIRRGMSNRKAPYTERSYLGSRTSSADARRLTMASCLFAAGEERRNPSKLFTGAAGNSNSTTDLSFRQCGGSR